MAREVDARGGEISFRDYMELALYHPRHGYYCAATPRYGRGGDFLTAPTASPWYATVLADLLDRLAARVGPIAFCDVASGDGSLIAVLTAALARRGSRAIRRVGSVERSPAMRAVQTARLRDAEQAPLAVVGSIEELELSSGPTVVHACELFDAVPVHRVVMRSDGLKELRVATRGSALGWRESAAGAELVRYFAGHGVSLAPGQIAEARPDAGRLHRNLLGLAGEAGPDQEGREGHEPDLPPARARRGPAEVVPVDVGAEVALTRLDERVAGNPMGFLNGQGAAVASAPIVEPARLVTVVDHHRQPVAARELEHAAVEPLGVETGLRDLAGRE